ncbi:MAG TPA: 30S ribosomal protein S16 [Sphingomonadales bacterium]|nr:30S ribosomal protein S16 [Sphingomonadales bacterium]
MALTIRMSRGGAKKRPFFRIVVADSRFPRDGRYIERLGHYNPLLPKDHAERLKMDVDKVKAWLAKGATPSDRISRFLEEAGVLPKKTRSNPEKGKPSKKTLEKAAAREEAKKTRAEAEAKAAEEAKVAAAKAAEEAKAAKEAAPSEEAKPAAATKPAEEAKALEAEAPKTEEKVAEEPKAPEAAAEQSAEEKKDEAPAGEPKKESE